MCVKKLELSNMFNVLQATATNNMHIYIHLTFVLLRYALHKNILIISCYWHVVLMGISIELNFKEFNSPFFLIKFRTSHCYLKKKSNSLGLFYEQKERSAGFEFLCLNRVFRRVWNIMAYQLKLLQFCF